MQQVKGSLSLLGESVAQELLRSSIPARLAYNWTDGTPRVSPVWFHWNGQVFVTASPPSAPKMRALNQGDQVAFSIDDITYPYKMLQVRGTVHFETVQNTAFAEVELMAKRYLGEDAGQSFLELYRSSFPTLARITITPAWVGLIDMVERFPSAWER